HPAAEAEFFVVEAGEVVLSRVLDGVVILKICLHLPTTHPGGWTRRTWANSRQSHSADIFSGSLRRPIRGSTRLRRLLRQRTPLPQLDALPAVLCLGQCAGAKRQTRRCPHLVRHTGKMV